MSRYFSQIKKRKPPHFSRLSALLNDPTARPFGSGHDGAMTLWIAAGQDSWRFADERDQFAYLVIPPFDDPEKYDWCIATHKRIRGPVLLASFGSLPRDYEQAIVVALMKAGVSKVMSIDINSGKGGFFVVEGASHAA